jgi:hypothetical protein
MNKKELRDKFFKEHTYKCENGISLVVTHPHQLFEWMYEQLILSGVSKRFTENKMDDAYDKGYNDGYATGSTIM